MVTVSHVPFWLANAKSTCKMGHVTLVYTTCKFTIHFSSHLIYGGKWEKVRLSVYLSYFFGLAEEK